jgi:MFS family permease
VRTIERLRGFPRPVYLVAAARFVNTFGSGVVYPFATLYFHLVLGFPLSLVGVGLLANNVATAAGTLIGGYLADRYGRKPVMVSSMGLAAPALASYALVETVPAFVVVATAVGLALGLFAPAAQAAVADATDSSDREGAYALLKVASNAGFGSGFVAGGLLYGVARTAIFVVDGLTSAVVAVVLVAFLARTHDGSRDATGLVATVADWGRAVSNRTVFALALLNVGFAVMYSQMQATVPVFAEARLGLTSEQLGTLYVLNPLVIVVFQLPIVERIEGWRRTRGLVASAGFWGLSFVALLGVFGAPWVLGVALVGAFLVARTVGEILHSPLMTALTSDVGEAVDRGSHLSVVEVAKRLGFGIGPVIGGAYFDAGTVSPGQWGLDLDAVALLWVSLLVGCGLLVVALLAVETRLPATVNGRTLPAD